MTTSWLERKRPLLVQFITFIFVGLVSAIITLVSRHYLNYLMIFELAVAASQLIGVLVAFSLSRSFVFESSKRPVMSELVRFSVVNVGALALATGVSSLSYRLVLPMLDITRFPEMTAHLIGLASCAFPSFFAHKHFTFRQIPMSKI